MPTTHRLRATIADIDPSIWREIEIDSTASLRDLHDALQKAFGWQRSHLWLFRFAGQRAASTSTTWGITGATSSRSWRSSPGGSTGRAASAGRVRRRRRTAAACPGTRSCSWRSRAEGERKARSCAPGPVATTPSASRAPRPRGGWRSWRSGRVPGGSDRCTQSVRSAPSRSVGCGPAPSSSSPPSRSSPRRLATG